jgi:hypothetical protein
MKKHYVQDNYRDILYLFLISNLLSKDMYIQINDKKT